LNERSVIGRGLDQFTLASLVGFKNDGEFKYLWRLNLPDSLARNKRFNLMMRYSFTANT
jgi:hypothetical protein